jgi:hypothetical protein
MRHITAVAILVAISTATPYADLRFTTRTEIRQTAKPDAAAAELGAALLTLMPSGETQTFIGGGSIRIETTVAPRPVVLLRPDGQFILYPESQTYFRMPGGQSLIASSTASLSPTFVRTGEFTTLLGLRSERVLVTLVVNLPTAVGFPTRTALEGEIWLADAYRTETGRLSKALPAVPTVPSGLEGMVMRQVFRHPQLGFEFETRVVEVTDEPIAPGTFDLPAGYRLVDLPSTSSPPPGALHRRQP